MFESGKEQVSQLQSQLSYIKKEQFAVDMRIHDRKATVIQNRANALEQSILQESFPQGDIPVFIQSLKKEIKSKDDVQILKSFQKVKAIMKKNEYIPELLVKNDLIEACCSFLEDVASKEWERKELSCCLENLSWITTNISAMPGNQTSILTKNGIITSYVRILLEDSAIISKEILENILLTFQNILLDFIKEAFVEIEESDDFFRKLIEFKGLLFGNGQISCAMSGFLKSFTHNAFFYNSTHDPDLISPLLELNCICIDNFPSDLQTVSEDNEEYFNSSISSVIDCLNFYDNSEYFLIMQENLVLLVDITSILQTYHNILRDCSEIFKFLLGFLERIEGCIDFWNILEIEQVFKSILMSSKKAKVIEKTIECISVMINTNVLQGEKLFLSFSELIKRNFEKGSLKTKYKSVLFFNSLLLSASSSQNFAKTIFEYFEKNHFYQDIISLLDSENPDFLIRVLDFLREYLILSDFFNGQAEFMNFISSIKIWVKEFCRIRIEKLLVHEDISIGKLSARIYDEYFE